uniref:Uncharacterized protein n=1 Tax=Anguilla anguilla TaxID=7936 RepID=A0A0E9UTV5_ANGAN
MYIIFISIPTNLNNYIWLTVAIYLCLITFNNISVIHFFIRCDSYSQ